MDNKNIINKALPLVKKWEGFVGSPYYCPALKLTIGYGERIDLRLNKQYGKFLGSDIDQMGRRILTKNSNNIKKTNTELRKMYGILIEEEEASQDLIKELEKEYWIPYKNRLKLDEMTENQCGAIVSFVYNIGVNQFVRSTMFRLLTIGEVELAGKELNKWVFSGGKKLRGLVNRRKDETDLFFN